ncbi:glycosyltransferase [Jatrophihabitans endophyticus]|uniref:glycosyltransferase n=1 Tax=Jatrophihabitans endophyticus TaxID=1206085 RepID=UPI0019ECEA13|nr:glycosyltransferase [Jatrophihabitans endophyticus]MBE7187701.1 glycosyltransferase [Jatrophihabitans endophyticus]
MTTRGRLRVVHVITTLTTGGAERQVELLAAASRHDVAVVSLYTGGVVEDALRARGIPVHVLGMDGWRKAAAVLRLARLLRRLQPDVVHVHLLSAQLWGIPAARLAGVPVVVSTEHSIMDTTIEGRPKSEWLRRLYLALERRTTETIAVSAETARRLRAWGVGTDRRLTVINPPIDFTPPETRAADRSAVRRELGIPDDAVVIGAVGRLDVVKRHATLVRAVADQLRRGRHLVIVGDGSLRADLERLAAELGVARAVHLTGPRGDVPALFAAVDVLVSASRDETFGMAVVEALGAGLPVVFEQCPALDGLPLPRDRARRIDRDLDAADEREALAEAVDQLVAGGAELRPAPDVLVDRYGTARTAAAVDGVYERLVTRCAPSASSTGAIRSTTQSQV